MKIRLAIACVWMAVAPVAAAETAEDILDRAYALSEQEDTAGARALFSQACDAGSATGCTELEAALRYDTTAPDAAGADRAVQRARMLMEQGCDGGDVDACFDLENLLRYNSAVEDPAGADAALQKGNALQARACDAGAYATCMSLADAILHASVDNGGSRTLGPEDDRQMQAYLTKARAGASQACTAGDREACSSLGLMEVSGWGGPKTAAGLDRLRSSCFAGEEPACWNWGSLLTDGAVDMPRDLASIQAFARQACAANQESAFCKLASDDPDTSMLPGFSELQSVAGLDLPTAVRQCDAGLSAAACGMAQGAYNGSLRYNSASKAIARRLTRQWNRLECDAGRLSYCLDRAHDLQAGTNGAPDDAAARSLLETVCNSEPQDGDTYTVSSACHEVADIINADAPYNDDGVPAAGAMPYYQRACKYGDDWACAIADPSHSNPDMDTAAAGDDDIYMIAEPDEPPAPPLTQDEKTKLCLRNISQACRDTGGVQPETYDSTDPVGDLALFVRGCDNDYAEACIMQGRWMIQGIGGPKDVPGGVDKLQHSCDLGNGVGCGDAGGVLMSGGDGLPIDNSRAWLVLKSGCTYGDAWSCWQAGLISDSNQGCDFRGASAQGCLPNYPEARQFFQRGCDLGNYMSCGDLGAFLVDGRSPTGQMIAVTDPVTGQTVAAQAPGVASDMAGGEAAFRRACPLDADQPDVDSCDRLGGLLVSGQLGDARQSEAVPYFRKACDVGAAPGCGNLAALYGNGIGVKKSRKLAKQYFQQACSMGEPTACSAARNF